MASLNGKKIPTLYDLFHRNPLSGKGISKNDTLPRNFKNFFKLTWYHLNKITSVNLIFLLAIFPIFFLLLGFSGLLNQSISSPASPIFPLLFDSIQREGSDPITAALYSIHGSAGVMSITSTATKVMYGLGALVVLTFGFANVGSTYILRNLVKGEPVFVWHDFWYVIKRNLRQGFIFGIVDVIILVVIFYDTFFFFFNMGTYTSSLFFFAILLLGSIYLMMRFYIYNLIITFDLSIFKVIKNAFIFSILGLKRNIAALFGIIIITLIDYWLLSVLLPLGIMLPLIFLYAYGAYMGSYASWLNIKKYMIDPYAIEDETDGPKDVESIFKDDVKK